MGSTYKRTWNDKDGHIHHSDIWWIKYYRAGKSYRESSGSRKQSDAKRLLKLREGDIARGVPITPKVGRVKFNELTDDVTNDYRINERRYSSNSRSDYTFTSCHFLEENEQQPSPLLTFGSSSLNVRRRVLQTRRSIANWKSLDVPSIWESKPVS
jgi:hypothetical protein